MTDVTSNEKYGDANPGNQQHGSESDGRITSKGQAKRAF